MIENLTKENFWNELLQQYPDAMEHFCKWIDDYKKEVNWDELFHNDHRYSTREIKFHDIPFEMQNGIIARFEVEVCKNVVGYGKEKYASIANEYKMQVYNIFYELQRQINRRQTKLAE